MKTMPIEVLKRYYQWEYGDAIKHLSDLELLEMHATMSQLTLALPKTDSLRYFE